MAELVEGFAAGLKKVTKAAKNVVLQTSEPERMVKDATTMDKWGPTATQMREITQLTFSDDTFLVVMNALMKRLSEPGKFWRHVYKALLVIDYILKNGSDEVAVFCREHVVEIQTLTHFQQIDEVDSKDVGINVRERAKLIIELLHDETKLADERKRSNAARSKSYVGVSNEDAGSLPRGPRSSASPDESKWGMSRGETYDYSHGYSVPEEQKLRQPPRLPAASDTTPVTAMPAPASAPKKTAVLIDTQLPAATPAVPAAPVSASATLFAALGPDPVSPGRPAVAAGGIPAAPVTHTADFFDPRAPAPSGPAADFFDPRSSAAAAAAPAPVLAQGPLFPPVTSTATAPAPGARAGTGSSAELFGDFEEAKPAEPAKPAAKDLWSSGLVNLDSLGSTAATRKDPSSASSAGKKIPMAAITATGPAIKAPTTVQRQPASLVATPVMTPTPAGPGAYGRPATGPAPGMPGYGMPPVPGAPGYGYGYGTPGAPGYPQPRPF